MGTDKLNYKKACEDALKSMSEEFRRGAVAMLHHIQEHISGCYGKKCNCSICYEGNKFLRRLRKNDRF